MLHQIDQSLLRLHGRPPIDAAPPGDAVAADAAFEPAATRTVYGALLNHRDALAALGGAVHRSPYKAPPQAPVLYIKPANTWIGHGAPIPVPADAPELEMGAALAVVVGRTACRVSEAEALDHVAGYTIANDVSVPHAEFYRPSVRLKCRDGFLPIGPWVTARRRVADPDALTLRVWVDGELRLVATTAELIRPVARLLADVTEFMTLVPGDVLLTGVPAGAPRARAGQRVAIEIDGLGRLENPLVAEGACA